MLEAAGDLRRMSACFENPALKQNVNGKEAQRNIRVSL